MRNVIAHLLEPLRSLFFPAHCAGCGHAVVEGNDMCLECAKAVEKIKAPRCEVCSQPYDGKMPVFTCPNCRGEAFHFECAVAVMRSHGLVRELVHRMKYGREIWLGRIFGKWMSEGLKDTRLNGVDFDAIIPVPLHPKRLREREFNQAFVLANEVACALGVPIIEPLVRCRYTTTQTRLDRKARRQNLRDAFVLRKNVDVRDKDLLLVDDVLTTGSTLDACADVLLDAGACSVRAITVARG